MPDGDGRQPPGGQGHGDPSPGEGTGDGGTNYSFTADAEEQDNLGGRAAAGGDQQDSMRQLVDLLKHAFTANSQDQGHRAHSGSSRTAEASKNALRQLPSNFEVKMHLLSLALPTLLLGVAIGQSDDSSYLGCFSDPAENRVFEWQSSTSAMTADECSELCSGSDFYGTQYSTECWCGDNVEYAINGPSDCDMPCSGNSDEICGGAYALSVYSNDPDYLGCWSDPYSAETRLFPILIDASDDMTTAVCEGLCANYAYYGTQYGTECWCGDEDADYDANGASNECVMPCAGDTSETCGGFDCMSVYQNEVDIPVDPGYRGCYSDPGTNRVFVQDTSSDEMTAELCATHCADSDAAFYGTQYSRECWCGDINAQYSVNGVGECDMTCSGNSDETCGGAYSMDVYAQDPAYLGCFSDPADDRMFVWESSNTAMTAEACASRCSGSTYYGTQYSQECWCGDNADYAANGFGVCDMPCTGNSDEMCGGPYTMSVYQAI